MPRSRNAAVVRNITLATLLTGAAFFLGACYTAPTVTTATTATTALSEPSENKTAITAEQLTSLLVKLAHEPALGSRVASNTPSSDVDGSHTLASNP